MATATTDAPQKNKEVTLNPEVIPDKKEPTVITWIYKPQVENNGTAPCCFQYPPTNIEAIKALASNQLAMSNAELPMESLWLYEGVNEIPIETVRAIQSHPASANVLERKVQNGTIEILQMDYADIEGVATDKAATIHYSPIKAIKLVNACFDISELKRWKDRDLGADRKEIRNAIDRRIAYLNEQEEGQRKSQESQRFRDI